ncbi:MAG: hypothetical protein K6D92_02520 [Erysipelotrichaceae bacterium]|nr:hypothetical protein [Erysipelotrichaceae bacterium]
MKKHLLLAVLLILALSLSACNPNVPKENDVPDASSSPETTKETVKPADVSTEEKNDPGSEVEFLWGGMEKEYTGDYSYLDLPFFRDYDVPTLRSACKVVKADSVEGMAGGWVYCEELNEDLTYYDLKEVAAVLPGDSSMHLTENGYISDETILFKDSLFYQLLNESSEYTPIPGIYDYSTGIRGGDAFSEGEAKYEQGLVYFVNGNDVDRMSFDVVSLPDGHYILNIEYRVRESANTMATGEPKVKFSYYRSAAIVK